MPQSSTYAEPLLSITWEVISRERPGTGPAAVPSNTSLVPFASLSAACACCAVQRGPTVCAKLCSVVLVTIGAAASPASRLRRESSDGFDVSVIVYLPWLASTCTITRQCASARARIGWHGAAGSASRRCCLVARSRSAPARAWRCWSNRPAYGRRQGSRSYSGRHHDRGVGRREGQKDPVPWRSRGP